MKRFPILVIWLILGSFSLVELSRGAAPEADALSPYFLVETAESPLENFPLKETRVEVTIVGVIADVTVSAWPGNTIITSPLSSVHRPTA